MLEAFPPERRGKAMAFWALGIVVAPMLGPVLGGWITDTYSWRWVFYINLPVGIMATIMARLFVFDPPYIGKKSEYVDYIGMAFLVIGIGSLQVFLDKGQTEDWWNSNFIKILAVMCVLGLIAFVIRELTTKHPIVDLTVFKNRTYATGVFMMTILGFVLYGSTVLLPIWLQTLLGYPALQSGMAMLPRGLGSFLFMPVVGILMGKIEPRKLLIFGLCVAGYSLILLGRLNLNAGYWDIFWPQILQGSAMGLLFVPLTTVTNDPIAKEKMGNATSIFNLMRNIGASIGIAMVTTTYARSTRTDIDHLSGNATPYSPAFNSTIAGLQASLMKGGSDAYSAGQQAYAAVFGMIQREAAMLAFIKSFRLLGFLFFAMIPLVFLMRKPRHKAGPGAGMH
jgi:DHA2 family multidrug resistance protein